MRGKTAPKRDILPDPKFQNTEVAKFVNYVMRRGKKSVAQSIVYGAFDLIAAKTEKNPVETFELAIKNVAPTLEVKGRRIGGANYQIPIQVKAERRFLLACRWIIDASKERKGKPMAEKLAQELMDAAKKEGSAMKKRETVQKMAEANRAFAHFAR
ncbi:MAG: 30S ribosomal protein S7 [Parcubacteria group bacterium]|nr:30S ribosomal protein S7 [Parcubacteria group bacterium]